MASSSKSERLRRLLRPVFSGWGRRAAWGALLLALIAGAFANEGFWAPRFALFDAYERVLPRLEHANPVVIVAIDDKSLRRIGQWPWPRQTLAALLEKVLAAKPAAVGFDMFFAEPDRSSPGEWLKHAGPMAPSLHAAIEALPSHDRAFSDVIASGPVALGVGGLRLEEPANDTGRIAPFLVSGGEPDIEKLPQFDAALRSIPLLDDAAAGHGIISVDPDADGVFRKLPLVVSLNGRLAPALPVEILRLAAGTPVLAVQVARGSIDTLKLGPLAIPTESDGGVWVHYSPHDDRRFVSAADVLTGAVNGERFAQRIVMISASGGTGLLDYRQTPVGIMSGTEIQAQFIENILEGRYASRPAWAGALEFGLTLLLGLLLILIAASRPRMQALVALGAIGALFGIGFLLWSQTLFLVDVATPALGVFFVFIALTAGNLAEAERHRRRLRRELQERKLAEAKAMGELEAGRRIQLGMLPQPSSVTDPRIDLDARMIAARQVGGDLYDFFKINNETLFFAIGDVSGKGIPAALFMALAKSQLRSAAMSGETSIAAIIDRTNRELSRNNPEMLFITMFAGILDLRNGRMSFVNAGHDTPYLVRAGLNPRSIVSEGGPPLCTVDDFDYRAETCLIEANDILCLLTDGVTEAMTKDAELMGRPRVEAALSGLPHGATARLVIDRLNDAVTRFVAGAEASDDLTLLVVRVLRAF
jgi:serine phosphatase RsbU (regulator of sigma subunit)/CHASE2 domain-containing sensor protein